MCVCVCVCVTLRSKIKTFFPPHRFIPKYYLRNCRNNYSNFPYFTVALSKFKFLPLSICQSTQPAPIT